MDFEFRKRLQEFQIDPNRNAWIDLLEYSRKCGLPLFTSEAIETATKGQLTNFAEDEDGFRAEIVGAFYPKLYALVPIGPEDSEYERYARWSGTISVDFWEDSDPIIPRPTLAIDADAVIEFPIYDWSPDASGWLQRELVDYQEYSRTITVFYRDQAVYNNSTLFAACRDETFYPLDKRGWDEG